MFRSPQQSVFMGQGRTPPGGYGFSSKAFNPHMHGPVPAYYSFERKPFGGHKVHRPNLGMVATFALLPTLLYAGVCGASCLYLRYANPGFTETIWALGAIVVLAFGYMAWKASGEAHQPHHDSGAGERARWGGLIAAGCLAALLAGIVMGDWNFYTHLQPYFDIIQLQHYDNVDTSVMSGNEMMDAGHILFKEGTFVDLRKSMGFHNVEWYCVAPITTSGAQISSYDFWAIGLNCCNGPPSGGASTQFACGEFNNMAARSGLRLMHEEQRPYYRLAVQQAQAAYGINADHPLFFYFLQDPVAEVNSYRDNGFKYFMLSCFIFCFCNLLAAVFAWIWFSKHKPEY